MIVFIQVAECARILHRLPLKLKRDARRDERVRLSITSQFTL